jgi:hypothetical protein
MATAFAYAFGAPDTFGNSRKRPSRRFGFILRAACMRVRVEHQLAGRDYSAIPQHLNGAHLYWPRDETTTISTCLPPSGAVVGRILKVHPAPVGSPWMWTLMFGHHEDRTPTHGYAETREAAMAAFAKSWRRE